MERMMKRVFGFNNRFFHCVSVPKMGITYQFDGCSAIYYMYRYVFSAYLCNNTERNMKNLMKFGCQKGERERERAHSLKRTRA